MKRVALALVLTLSLASAAFAQTPALASPRPSPVLRLSLPPRRAPPLPPRADGVPADMAFGAYQRGNFLYALLEAERRLDANPKDTAAMTLIGEIYRDGAAVPRTMPRLTAGTVSPAI